LGGVQGSALPGLSPGQGSARLRAEPVSPILLSMKDKFILYTTVVSLVILFGGLFLAEKNQKELDNTSDNNDEKVQEVEAEQTGSSPESGATSRLKQARDDLVTKGTNYGDVQPSDYPYDRGTYWNRILYSAFWEPDGTATETDVLSGKTFYSGSNDRVKKTGTLTPETSPGAYYEQFVQYDDYEGVEYGGESTWINTNSSAGSEVWYDSRTGLYWARSQPTTLQNSFSSPSTGFCSFFTTTPRGSYDGSDVDCGAAINACGTLSLVSTEGQSAKTDWYLPSQKELKQAYRDGIYNKTTPAFTTTRSFWSSTEYSSNSTTAWRENLHGGYANGNGKTNGYAVRCVRRD